MILTGQSSDDTGTGQIGPQVAEYLGLPSISSVIGLDANGATLTLLRDTEDGKQQVTVDTPVLVMASSGLNEPRYPSLKGIMAAKKKPLETTKVEVTRRRTSPGVSHSVKSAQRPELLLRPARCRGRGPASGVAPRKEARLAQRHREAQMTHTLFLECQWDPRQHQKGRFPDVHEECQPDVVCLQETKAQQGQAQVDLPDFKEYWNSALKLGYSGTAIFSKFEPIQVINGLPIEVIERSNLTGESTAIRTTKGGSQM